MTRTKIPKTLAQQIADLDDPAPKDFDPEDEIQPNADSDHDSGEDGEAVNIRDHYLNVGKSELRKSQELSLGPRYEGSRISREKLLEDDESEDDAFGSGTSQKNRSEESENGGDQEELADPDKMDVDEIANDEDTESDGAFGEGNDKNFQGAKFQESEMSQDEKRRYKKPSKIANGARAGRSGSSIESDVETEKAARSSDQDDIEIDPSDSESEEKPSEDESAWDSTSSRTTTDPQPDSRAALRAMMASEQKTVIASISRAAAADAVKGRAVIHQRRTFDALLNTRIRLQKALVATNTLVTLPACQSSSTPDLSAFLPAETAALNLWNELNALRESLHPTSSLAGGPKKRPFAAALDTPPDTLAEASTAILPSHRATITKWAARVQPATSVSKLSLAATPSQQPLPDMLDAQLQEPNRERLIAKTKVPRSCAPVQAAGAVKASKGKGDMHGKGGEGNEVFDDADFYAVLLRDLVERKMAAGPTPHPGVQKPQTTANDSAALLGSLRGVKQHRPNLDTKASKGRKMRYTVHEKLQNFMAPEERGGWGERQAEELFGGLLGARRGLGEGREMDGDEDEGGVGVEEEGLRLFGGGVSG